MRTDEDSLDTHSINSGTKQTGDASISTGKDAQEKNFLDITALIRSIQRAEGNPDCFQKGQGYCDQVDCAWRPYCLDFRCSSREGDKEMSY